MRAAIYIRVSTARQAAEGLSLAAQEKLLRGYCQQNGLEVVALYADEGISAKDTKHRPAFLQMMDDAQRNIFDLIVIWKLSRFSRSLMCYNKVVMCYNKVVTPRPKVI